MLGGLTGATSIRVSSLPLLASGTFLVGAYQGFAQFYRFATPEVAGEAFRPRAISLVLAGGVVAAGVLLYLVAGVTAWCPLTPRGSTALRAPTRPTSLVSMIR